METVHTTPTHSTLTGMRSLQSSPRVSRSHNSSPVAAGNQEQPPYHPDKKSDREEAETSLRTLRSSKTRDAGGKEKGVEVMTSSDNDAGTPDIPPHTKSLSKELSKDESPTITQTLQDSESAVTLLSLLKRGPIINPACPPKSNPSLVPIHTGVTALKLESTQDSPSRSPSSSSETDSVVKEASADLMSEDLTSELESTASGKTRGGGGGICSTLLAVIEQLRERLDLEGIGRCVVFKVLSEFLLSQG